MSKVQRRLTLAAAVFLALSYFLPIWQLDIQAPQYPEGLGMTIWLSHITGNLEQINLLNHYIGMKHITPSMIPELRVMPEALLILAGLGGLAAWINRRWALITWIVTLFSAGIFGLHDFYHWEYDYGHNLSPLAPIKVPGMSYQPPLLGHKQLLNIDAYSYPSFGAVMIGIALGLALLALFWSARKNPFRRSKVVSGARLLCLVLGLGGMFFLGSGCNASSEPVQIGLDRCASCRMTISDDRFGGEIITKKGKVYKFDAMDCLIRYYSQNKKDANRVLVLDFMNHGTFLPADKAIFFRSDRIQSPMGRGIVALRDRTSLKTLQLKLKKGEVLDWNSLLKSSSAL